MRDKELKQAVMAFASIILLCIALIMIIAVGDAEDSVFIPVFAVSLVLLIAAAVLQGGAIALAKKIDKDAERQAINEHFKNEMKKINGGDRR